jgi:hypothetical protein
VSRSFGNRMFDFMGRAVFGGENGFARDKRLALLAAGLAVLAIVSGNWFFGIGFAGVIVAVFVNDVCRYNREHENG